MATKPRSERQDISFHDELKRLLSKLRLHAAYLTKRAVHETGDEPLPDELLGRTCEQALLRQEQWSTGKLFNWLLIIMDRIWFGELRRQKARTMVPIDEHLLARTDDRFESEAFVGLMLGDIRRACEDVLTDDDFALLARTKQGKDSYQDIADDLGVPIGTLASRVGRIRNVIRKRLEEMGELT